MRTLDEIPLIGRSAVALGHFDGLHLGHREVINAAVASLSGEGERIVLSVGAAYKKHTGELGVCDSRIITEAERDGLLSDWGVDTLIAPPFKSLRDLSGEEFVKDILKNKLNAEVVSCGFNYRFGRGASCSSEQLAELCKKYGIRCEIAEPVRVDSQTVSSTAIRLALQSGDVVRAGAMLGRRYGYILPVSHGRGLGRNIGTPTINQIFPADMLMPRYGVYASRSFVAGAEHRSVTDIGVKPTVGKNDPQSETWILDFSGDLYEENVRVELVEFMRPEQRFASTEELRAQILRDAERARSI